MDTNRVVISIGNHELKIRTSESVQLLQKLADDVTKRLNTIYSAFPTVSDYEAALFAMLNMADEIAALQSKYDELESRIGELRDMPVVQPMPKKRPLTKKAVSKDPVIAE